MLAASGHIAGVVNHPAAEKYCYWSDSKTPKNPDKWLDGATEHPGSWWPEWRKWIKKFDGGQIKARQPGDGKLKPIENAPGSYVMVKAT